MILDGPLDFIHRFARYSYVPEDFTGIVVISRKGRDFSPYYFYKGICTTYKSRWVEQLWQEYKGTEREAEVLAIMLGA